MQLLDKVACTISVDALRHECVLSPRRPSGQSAQGFDHSVLRSSPNEVPLHDILIGAKAHRDRKGTLCFCHQMWQQRWASTKYKQFCGVRDDVLGWVSWIMKSQTCRYTHTGNRGSLSGAAKRPLRGTTRVWEMLSSECNFLQCLNCSSIWVREAENCRVGQNGLHGTKATACDSSFLSWRLDRSYLIHSYNYNSKIVTILLILC